jgi:hypothetical protein
MRPGGNTWQAETARSWPERREEKAKGTDLFVVLSISQKDYEHI